MYSNYKKLNITPIIFVLFGGFLAVVPELNVFLIVSAQIVFLRLKIVTRDFFVELFLMLWSIVRIIYYLRSNQLAVFGALEGIALWIFWQFFLNVISFLRKNHIPLWKNYLVVGISLGILLTFTITSISIFENKQQVWLPFKALYVKLESGSDVFYPKDRLSDYVVKDFGGFSPGKFTLIFIAKTVKDTTINLSLFQVGSERFNTQCKLRTTWTICKVKGNFAIAGTINGVFGSFLNNEWKEGDSPVVVREFKISQTYGSKFDFNMFFQGRNKGLSFNENAFGAWMAALGLLLINLRVNLVSLSGFAFCLILTLVSGSRNSFVSLILGTLIFSSKKVLHLTIFFSTTIFFALILNGNSLRAVDIFNISNYQDRIETFQKATSIIAKSPIVGVADFSQQLKSVKNSTIEVTHAHNLVLQILGESGLIGISIFIGIFVLIFKKNFNIKIIPNLSILVFLFLLNSFEYLFYYAPIQIIFWIAVLGLTSEFEIRN